MEAGWGSLLAGCGKGGVSMLNTSQSACLEAIVQAVHPALQVEEAALDPQQTLRLVLCNDFMCFQPLRITTAEVNIPAALAGDAAAQQALQAYVRATLQDLL